MQQIRQEKMSNNFIRCATCNQPHSATYCQLFNRSAWNGSRSYKSPSKTRFNPIKVNRTSYSNKHVHTHIHQQENNHIQKKFSFFFFFYFLILMIRKFELKKKERINKKNESKVHGIHFITTRTTANQSGVRPSDARQTKTLQQEK